MLYCYIRVISFYSSLKLFAVTDNPNRYGRFLQTYYHERLYFLTSTEVNTTLSLSDVLGRLNIAKYIKLCGSVSNVLITTFIINTVSHACLLWILNYLYKMHLISCDNRSSLFSQMSIFFEYQKMYVHKMH